MHLNHLSDWNPQLWREVKGRLTRRNVMVTAASSLFLQFILVRLFQQSASPRELWQSGMFYTLSWLATLVLMIMGCYLLVEDFAREGRQGTLTFLRLSPEPAWTILLGKVFGVPILLYWAIACTLPLHLWSGLIGGQSLDSLIGTYLFFLGACGFAYSYALVYAVSWGAKAQSWYVVGAACGMWLFLIGTWQGLMFLQSRDQTSFFFLLGGGILPCFALLIMPMWTLSLRRFRRPPPLYNPKTDRD